MAQTGPCNEERETPELSGMSDGERQELGILFVDLVDSSVFASTLSLEAYAEYVEEFKRMALTQCRYFFEDYLQGKYREWREYAASIVGDELVVFLRTGKPGNDVYLLTLLAVLIKAAWLGAPFNRARIDRDMPPSEVAAGINHGSVWAVWQDGRFAYTGYSINLAKRIESRSRTGERYRILATDRAVKLISLKVRNLLFGPRQLFEAKGILGSVGFHELAYSFVNPTDRLCPSLSPGLREILNRAMQASTHDSWIHDLIQNWSEAEAKAVTDSAFAMARQVLSHEPAHPVALYFFAQGLRERGRWEDARVALSRLTQEWPYFGDGHWEFGKLAKHLGEQLAARDAFRQAHLLGVEEASAELGPTGARDAGV
ncbi:MAG: hypothetical protein ACKV19_05575 [Verrucomicrobiales bacterium]